jgi:hypothetical protein
MTYIYVPSGRLPSLLLRRGWSTRDGAPVVGAVRSGRELLHDHGASARQPAQEEYRSLGTGPRAPVFPCLLSEVLRA